MRWNDTTATLVGIILIILAAWYTTPTEEQQRSIQRRDDYHRHFGRGVMEEIPPWP